MPDKKTLTLSDVSPIEASFANWTLEAAEREKEWFRWAWQAIIKAGLAEYRTELERCQVAIRCLALRYIYEDFFHLAQGEWAEPFFRDAADALEIKAFQLGILFKEEDWVYVEDITDTDEFYDCALRELTDKEPSSGS